MAKSRWTGPRQRPNNAGRTCDNPALRSHGLECKARLLSFPNSIQAIRRLCVSGDGPATFEIMDRQIDRLTNHRWWTVLRKSNLTLTMAGTQSSHDLIFSPRRNISLKKARKPAVMHRRLHMLLVQHGARPATWKAESL